MAQTDMTTDEVLDSLTGHEESWITEQFGRSIGALIPEPSMYRRALIFILKRREKVNDDDARNAVMDMRLIDVLEFFSTDSVEGAGDADESAEASVEPGKGEVVTEQPAEQPAAPLRAISQPSAS